MSEQDRLIYSPRDTLHFLIHPYLQLSCNTEHSILTREIHRRYFVTYPIYYLLFTRLYIYYLLIYYLLCENHTLRFLRMLSTVTSHARASARRKIIPRASRNYYPGHCEARGENIRPERYPLEQP